MVTPFFQIELEAKSFSGRFMNENILVYCSQKTPNFALGEDLVSVH